ncbi:MAG: toll/interleukin-1 receptor domain-containing protein [Nannocystaceae bacterium]
MSDLDATERRAVELLANLLHDRDQAEMVVGRAGFPVGSRPAFSQPLVFWSKVAQEACNGALPGRLTPLIEEALKLFPHNQKLQALRSGTAVKPPVEPLRRPAGQYSDLPHGYDVFLSHSTADKPAVESVAHQLTAAGLRPFFDMWHLVPGEPWIVALEKALETSATVAVFLGPGTAGKWREQETQLAQVQAAEEHSKRIIPVLLSGASKADVRGFLSTRTWVELGAADGFARLVAGIRGRPPGPAGGS